MLQATLYIRPNGDSRTIEISEIEAEDEQYLKDNNVVVSLEEVPPNQVAVYGRFTKLYGVMNEEAKQVEAFVLVPLSKGGKYGMSKLVEEIKRMKEEDHDAN